MSFVWRLNAIKIVFSRLLSGGGVGMLFGHGMYSGGEILSNMNFGNQFAYNVGTVDNSFVSALYDYGMVGLLWLVICIVWILKIIMKKEQDSVICRLSLVLLFLLAMAFFFEEFYWCNISFVFFTFLGMELYLVKNKKWKERK